MEEVANQNGDWEGWGWDMAAVGGILEPQLTHLDHVLFELFTLFSNLQDNVERCAQTQGPVQAGHSGPERVRCPEVIGVEYRSLIHVHMAMITE